jgi:hypothetical protein
MSEMRTMITAVLTSVGAPTPESAEGPVRSKSRRPDLTLAHFLAKRHGVRQSSAAFPRANPCGSPPALIFV